MSKPLRSNPENRAAFVSAAYSGNHATLQAMCDAGFDPDAPNKQGRRALTSAAENGHPRCVELLLARGANPNLCDQSGKTALIHAAQQDDASMISLLLTHGANVDIPGLALTHLAQTIMNAMGDDPVTELVLERVADIDYCDGVGQTLLMAALDSELGVTAQSLISRGASMQCVNNVGNHPIHVAASRSPAMLALVLPHVSDIDARNYAGETPLYAAKDTDCIASLLTAGAAMEARDKAGNTPLLHAIRTGFLFKFSGFAAVYTPKVNLLLNLGADIDAQSHRGETARSLVKAHKLRQFDQIIAAADARRAMTVVMEQHSYPAVNL